MASVSLPSSRTTNRVRYLIRSHLLRRLDKAQGTLEYRRNAQKGFMVVARLFTHSTSIPVPTLRQCSSSHGCLNKSFWIRKECLLAGEPGLYLCLRVMRLIAVSFSRDSIVKVICREWTQDRMYKDSIQQGEGCDRLFEVPGSSVLLMFAG